MVIQPPWLGECQEVPNAKAKIKKAPGGGLECVVTQDVELSTIFFGFPFGKVEISFRHMSKLTYLSESYVFVEPVV